MFQAVSHEYLVPTDGSFRVASAPSNSEQAQGKKSEKKRLRAAVDQLDDLQRILYAHDSRAILLVFQAMDAAGKDSTIRAVMRGVDPAGCQVFSFKKPSALELDHDFLWRTTVCLPERGRIGIFNRSYYEEVLIVRVHSSLLEYQRLPNPDDPEIWSQRFESIRNLEEHLARSGTVILKFWLNVSKEEQRRRFLSRIDEPEKNWKFNIQDVEEREHWDDYMAAYESALNETSRPWAPWYAIPADNKPYMRATVAEIVAQTMQSLGLAYPEVDPDTKAQFEEMRRRLG